MTTEEKMYWVGLDESGIMVATLDFHDLPRLSNVFDVPAINSDQAKALYNVRVAEDAEGQRYFESFHP